MKIKTITKLILVQLMSVLSINASEKNKSQNNFEKAESYVHDASVKVLIVGCGHNSSMTIHDDLTNQSPHKHNGNYFYIDRNPAVNPDIVGEFQQVSEKDMPEHSFDIIYFEHFNNYFNDLENFKAATLFASKFLKPRGEVRFDDIRPFKLNDQNLPTAQRVFVTDSKFFGYIVALTKSGFNTKALSEDNTVIINDLSDRNEKILKFIKK